MLAVAYVVGCVAALVGGLRSPVEVFGFPLVFVAGWIFLGHLMTLDDDAPGEWSNPEFRRSIWRKSILELLVKGAVFGLVCWTVILLL